jgi:hypothetical protein
MVGLPLQVLVLPLAPQQQHVLLLLMALLARAATAPVLVLPFALPQ